MCEKKLWYHYDFIQPTDNIRVLGCGRGCSIVPATYYYWDGVLPTSNTGYTTADECCAENVCEVIKDRCNPTTKASTSSATAVTTNTRFSALGIMTEGRVGGVEYAFGLIDDTNEEKGLFV